MSTTKPSVFQTLDPGLHVFKSPCISSHSSRKKLLPTDQSNRTSLAPKSHSGILRVSSFCLRHSHSSTVPSFLSLSEVSDLNDQMELTNQPPPDNSCQLLAASISSYRVLTQALMKWTRRMPPTTSQPELCPASPRVHQVCFQEINTVGSADHRLF